jgi:ribonucleoside-diphosphate reductase alpha chain
MDNVTDKARYPLAEQRAEAYSKRRMGIGVTGLANAGEAMGFPYGSPDFVAFEEKVLEQITLGSYAASSDLAAEKGSFPLFDAERYLTGKFAATLPDDLQARIRTSGIRNSHLTSIAPTGTISLTADNVSSALEPVFSFEIQRPINTPSGPVIEKIEDYGMAFLGTQGKLARDVTADEHIAVLTAAQRHIDSAVSKTVNMDGRAMPWQAFKDIYRRVWEQGCKGCATFNLSGKRGGLLETAAEEHDEPSIEFDACEIDPATGRRSCE